jgi:ferredoxin-NADP reductase
MSRQVLRIQSIVQETHNTKSFVLQELGDKIVYKPGQFLTFTFPTRLGEARRSYSLSSNPLLQEDLTITVKRIANGEYSRWLFDEAKVGDVMHTIGASGFFTLPENLSEHSTLLFLAAGSGITPIIALLKDALYRFNAKKVILIYSNHSEADTIFYSELLQLRKKFADRFTIEFLFSVNKNLLRARLGKHVLTQFIETHISDSKNTLVYICGPHDYMQMATIPLLNHDVPAENIRKEIFNTHRPVVKELPPDQNKHAVTILHNKKISKLEIQYPQTILQAAKENGIDLPYSCEAGRCGTCAATCIRGKVWMSRNEVLLDKETAQGRILTCTGYPIEGDVELVVGE